MSFLLNGSFAQNINFETDTPKAVSAYDYWEMSPFRTGKLEGQFEVIDNPAKDRYTNSTEKVLAFKRSRFGSNLYGARIDLKTPVQLSVIPSYIHVMLRTPHNSRPAIIGLGKRKDWDKQDSGTFQFVKASENIIPANKWTDAVFMIKGNEAVELHSIVVIPDTRSMLPEENDYIVFIDEIVHNNDCKERSGNDNENMVPGKNRCVTEDAENCPAITEDTNSIHVNETAHIRLNITARMCHVYTVDGKQLPETIPSGKDYTFIVKMDSDYRFRGLRIRRRHYSENGRSFWKDNILTLEKDGQVTIPAEYTDGDMFVEILFDNFSDSDNK